MLILSKSGGDSSGGVHISVFSFVGVLVSHVLIVPGIFMIVNGQKAKAHKAKGLTPALTLGPSGVSARVAF